MLLAALGSLAMAAPALEIPLKVGDSALAAPLDDGIIVVHQVARKPPSLLRLDDDLQGVSHPLPVPIWADLQTASASGRTLVLVYTAGVDRIWVVRATHGDEPEVQEVSLDRALRGVSSVRADGAGTWLRGRRSGRERLYYVDKDDDVSREVALPAGFRVVSMAGSASADELQLHLRGARATSRLATLRDGRIDGHIDVRSGPGERPIKRAWRALGSEGTLVVGETGRRRTLGWFVARHDGQQLVDRVDLDLAEGPARLLVHEPAYGEGGLLMGGEVLRRTVASGALREPPRGLNEVVSAWRTAAAVALWISTDGEVRWQRRLALEGQVFPGLQQRVRLHANAETLQVSAALDGQLTRWTVDEAGTQVHRWGAPRLPGDVDLSTKGRARGDGLAWLWGTRSEPGNRTTFYVEVAEPIVTE